MFEALTERLQKALRGLAQRGTVSEKDLDQVLREVRLALLEADVHVQVVRQFVQAVRERALGAQVHRGLTPAQQVLDIVYQEIKALLGEGHVGLALAPRPPTVVMLVGLKGGGKTTTCAKLALLLRRQGQRPLMVAADPLRVAAADQLRALGRQLQVPVV